VEFTNQELDQRLRFYVNKYQNDWSTHLPALDFAHNSSWHSEVALLRFAKESMCALSGALSRSDVHLGAVRLGQAIGRKTAKEDVGD
jgi:hypothetical protein